MVSLRGLVAVPTILVCGLLADTLAQSNPEKARKSEAQAVLDKVRDTFRRLSAYHFERVLIVEEARGDGKLANIAQLTLTTATENAKPAPDGSVFPPVNLERFRVGTKTQRGEMLQVCDGQTCGSHTSPKNEYMTGQRFRDVSTSVGGSMLLGLHLFGFLTLEEGAVQNANVAGEEEVEVGKERRACYVIEGVIRPRPAHRDPTTPPPPATPGVDWFLSMLALQGILDESAPRLRYSQWPLDEKAAGGGEPTRVTLWIDKNLHIVVRSKLSTQLYKHTLDNSQAVEQVAVLLTDRFTIAALGAPPAELFRFTPPEGAKEVPNVASRRDKRK